MLTVSKSGDLSGVAREIERAAVQGQKDAGRAVAKQGRKFILDDVRGARGSLRMMGGRLGVKQRITATLSLPVTRKPDLWVGTAPGRVILGDGSTPVVTGTSTTSSSDRVLEDANA